MADCMSPDSPDSPGAVFLLRVASDLPEIADVDDIHEFADAAVPIYTHDRWLTFVDLGAYQEDVTEFGTDADDLTQCAAVALYMIATRLLHALVEEKEA